MKNTLKGIIGILIFPIAGLGMTKLISIFHPLDPWEMTFTAILISIILILIVGKVLSSNKKTD